MHGVDHPRLARCIQERLVADELAAEALTVADRVPSWAAVVARLEAVGVERASVGGRVEARGVGGWGSDALTREDPALHEGYAEQDWQDECAAIS